MTTATNLLLLLGAAAMAAAHPSAIGGGRASCGKEYDAPEHAYDLPDISESWFLRRVATCDSPIFWQSFDTRDHMPIKDTLYIGGNTPMVERYADQLKLNIVLFGPSESLPNASKLDLPESVLQGLSLDSAMLKGMGAKVLDGSPEDYTDCKWLTNPVMSQYTKPMSQDLSGTGEKISRCTEYHKYDREAGKPAYLRYNRYWTVYWTFDSHEKNLGRGKHYVASWLSDRKTGEVMNGKYEMTMGPYTWGGYADAATAAATQEQGTTCTCGYNTAEYNEQNLDKIGVTKELLAYRLQPERCTTLAGGAGNGKGYTGGAKGADTCHAGGLEQQLSSDTEMEWSAHFTLAPGKYTWKFNPFGEKSEGLEYAFPDKAMNIFITPAASIDAAQVAGDAALKAILVEGAGATYIEAEDKVDQNGALRVDGTRAQAIQFTHDHTEGTSAVFTLTVPDTKGDGSPTQYAVFTQHQPWEFAADFLLSVDGTGATKYHFPTDSRFYDVEWPDKVGATATAATATQTADSGASTAAASVITALAAVVVAVAMAC